MMSTSCTIELINVYKSLSFGPVSHVIVELLDWSVQAATCMEEQKERFLVSVHPGMC